MATTKRSSTTRKKQSAKTGLIGRLHLTRNEGRLIMFTALFSLIGGVYFLSMSSAATANSVKISSDGCTITAQGKAGYIVTINVTTGQKNDNRHIYGGGPIPKSGKLTKHSGGDARTFKNVYAYMTGSKGTGTIYAQASARATRTCPGIYN